MTAPSALNFNLQSRRTKQDEHTGIHGGQCDAMFLPHNLTGGGQQ
ncbi:MAG: hypothetical protein AAFY56_07620 [Pseudomonadota bacterium]